MNIDQAIKDLQARVAGEFCIQGIDDCADMKLGIEAMKEIKYLREIYVLHFNEVLPGEDIITGLEEV